MSKWKARAYSPSLVPQRQPSGQPSASANPSHWTTKGHVADSTEKTSTTTGYPSHHTSSKSSKLTATNSASGTDSHTATGSNKTRGSTVPSGPIDPLSRLINSRPRAPLHDVETVARVADAPASRWHFGITPTKYRKLNGSNNHRWGQAKSVVGSLTPTACIRPHVQPYRIGSDWVRFVITVLGGLLTLAMLVVPAYKLFQSNHSAPGNPEIKMVSESEGVTTAACMAVGLLAILMCIALAMSYVRRTTERMRLHSE